MGSLSLQIKVPVRFIQLAWRCSGSNARRHLASRTQAGLVSAWALSAGEARTIGLQPRYSPHRQARSCPSSHCSAAAKSSPRAQKRSSTAHTASRTAPNARKLAADRTVFAAERTCAAWVRTGLLALASGIGAKALLSEVIPEWLIIATGSILVLFSAFCFGAAVWRHLEPGVPPPRVDVSRIPSWILVAVNGFLALVAVAALVGSAGLLTCQLNEISSMLGV
jgi:putative membrane protein